jgi:hypothetical protein
MTAGARILGRHTPPWLAAGVILLAGLVTALLPMPAAIADADAAGRRTFAALASAAIVTVGMLSFAAVAQRAARRTFAVAAALALMLGAASFSVGGYAERACTALYDNRPLVIGTDLTPLGASYRQANPELTTDELLFDAAGQPERIWTRESIGRCATFIGTTYFLWLPFLVVCLIATAQAIPTSILAPVRRGAVTASAPAVPEIRYDVFISYRHGAPDQTFARDLVAGLEAEGYRVAIDERDFAANASFLQEMERCIRESRFTVAVISPRYLESGNTGEEAMITKVLDMGDRKRRLIPLVIEPVAMPVWLYGIVGIDWTKQEPLVDPFDKLKATLGAPGLPAPPTARA